MGIVSRLRMSHKRKAYNILLLDGAQISVNLTNEETHGSDLLIKVLERANLSGDDAKYFGLLYSEKEDGGMNWLGPDDELRSVGRSKSTFFQFAVRFYPEHPDRALKNEITRKLFRSHLKEMLVRGELGCCIETHAILDGHIVQAEIGSYNPSKHKVGYLKHIKNVEICAPTFLNSDTDIKEAEYLRKVNWFHRRNVGISSSDADIMFLAKVKKLPFYGIVIYKTVIHHGTEVCLGLSGDGIVMFDDTLSDRCKLPAVLMQHPWKTLHYCLRDKNKVKLGILDYENNVEDIVLKLKSKNSFKRAERLHKEILAFRDMFLVKDDTDFYTSKKIYKKVQRTHSAKERFAKPVNRTNRFHSLSSNFRSSFKAKLTISPDHSRTTSPTSSVTTLEQKEPKSVDSDISKNLGTFV